MSPVCALGVQAGVSTHVIMETEYYMMQSSYLYIVFLLVLNHSVTSFLFLLLIPIPFVPSLTSRIPSLVIKRDRGYKNQHIPTFPPTPTPTTNEKKKQPSHIQHPKSRPRLITPSFLRYPHYQTRAKTTMDPHRPSPYQQHDPLGQLHNCHAVPLNFHPTNHKLHIQITLFPQFNHSNHRSQSRIIAIAPQTSYPRPLGISTSDLL